MLWPWPIFFYLRGGGGTFIHLNIHCVITWLLAETTIIPVISLDLWVGWIFTRFPPSRVTLNVTLSVQLSSSHCSHDRHLQDVNKGYLLVNVQNRVTGTPVSQSTYLLYGVSFPIVMGKRSASLSSALTQIRSPHGPLLNSTTWRTLGGTATDTRHEPSALTQKTKYR